MANVAKYVIGALIVGCAVSPIAAQNSFENLQKERARQMLRDVADGLRKHYYDPKYHGVDIEANFRTADENIRKAASLGDALVEVAQVLVLLHDSHTFFV